MSKELTPGSTIGDLVDYLLEHKVDLIISMPDDRDPSITIRVDRRYPYRNRARRATERISMNAYDCVPKNLRTTVVARSICSLTDELQSLMRREMYDQIRKNASCRL